RSEPEPLSIASESSVIEPGQGMTSQTNGAGVSISTLKRSTYHPSPSPCRLLSEPKTSAIQTVFPRYGVRSKVLGTQPPELPSNPRFPGRPLQTASEIAPG